MIVTDPRTGVQYDDQTGEIYLPYSSVNRAGPTRTGRFRPGLGPQAQQPGQQGQTQAQPQAQPQAQQPGQQGQTQAQPQAQPQAQNALLDFGGSQDPGIQLFQKTYGTSPLDYEGHVKEAYENLGQPTGGREVIAANALLSLAKPYIDTVLKQTGKLPAEDEVKQFVASNFNAKYAEDVITGKANYDQIISGKVNPYIEQAKLTAGTGTTPATQEIDKGILGLNDLNEQLFQAAKAQTERDAEEAYTPQKRGLVEDLAAQNQLGQRNSRFSLDALEAAKSKGLASALGNVAVARAQGGLDIGKTAQTLLAGQRSLDQQARQYGLDFGLRRQMFNKEIDDSSYERGLKRQQMGLAAQLGRQQAEGSKPGWMDYTILGFQGLGAIGGLAGGLGMAFCWVAEELYGKDSEKTHSLRAFMLNQMDKDTWVGKFARAYSKYGQIWANQIKKDTKLRQVFQNLYDKFYEMSLRGSHA